MIDYFKNRNKWEQQFTTRDIKFIIELVNSSGWIECINDRNIKTEEQVASLVTKKN
ncbi:MAG TPA: hypothetical protein VFO70_05060 [Chitinophagaceae bacterium]|nr:hypothetical protein [Chitinophagaceae bacterium]